MIAEFKKAVSVRNSANVVYWYAPEDDYFFMLEGGICCVSPGYVLIWHPHGIGKQTCPVCERISRVLFDDLYISENDIPHGTIARSSMNATMDYDDWVRSTRTSDQVVATS